MKEERKQSILAEFGEEQGKAIIEEAEQIEEHCRINKITNHSINIDGVCNMGCC